MEFDINFFNNQISTSNYYQMDPLGYYQKDPFYYPQKHIQKSSSVPNIFGNLPINNNIYNNYENNGNYYYSNININNNYDYSIPSNNFLNSINNYDYGNNYENKYSPPINNFLSSINNNYDSGNNYKNKYDILEKQYLYKKEFPKKYNLSNIKNINNFNYDFMPNYHKKNYDFKPTNMNNIKKIQDNKKTYKTNSINNINNLYPQNKNLGDLKPKFFSFPKKDSKIIKSIFEQKYPNKINLENKFDNINNKKEDVFCNKKKLSSLIQEKNSKLSPHKIDYINKNKKTNKTNLLSTILDFYNPNKTNLINLEKFNSGYNKNSYEAKDIKIEIVSLSKEIKINKLKINLIFFFEDFSNENVDLYNKLKLDILGGFFGVRKVEIFKKLLYEIKMDKSDSSFILISIGSSFEKIVNICDNYDCIKYIIIFCMKVNKYRKKYGENPKVKLISKDQKKIYDYLIEISNDEPNYNKNLKNLINHNLLISFYEYENYYYIHHKMLSFFFKEDYSKLYFDDDYMEKVFNFINQNTDLKNNEKKKLKQIIENLKYSNNFLEDILKFYTSESKYVYLFNKTMRNIEVGMERLSFLIGPMYYTIVRYLMKNNSNLMFKERNNLYRNIYINQYDLENYYMAQGKIICFPSFTSTSFKNEFEPTINALKINHFDSEKILLKMELSYTPKYDDIPQGMILKDFSANPNEEEILLFPLTFIKVNSTKKRKMISIN